MISKNVQRAFNEQINRELFSAYLYAAIAAVFAQKSLDGFANWFKIQAREEVAHAEGFFNYIIERGGAVELGAIASPQFDGASCADMFAISLEHEKFVTASIDSLCDLADAERDRASALFLQWYVREQVEEEATFQKILDNLRTIGDNRCALMAMDAEFAKREFCAPHIQ